MGSCRICEMELGKTVNETSGGLVDDVGQVVDGEVDYIDVDDSLSTSYMHVLLLYIAPMLLTLIAVVGVVGNSFVIYVIVSTPRMRASVTNILLLNLAVADLNFLVVCAPFMAYKYATVSWTFGDVVCKLVGFSTYTSSYVTVYTLVAISALRYVLIVRAHGTNEFGYHTDVRKVGFFVSGLWFCMGACNVPTMMAHTTKNIDVYNLTYCGIQNGWIKPIFISFSAFGYAVPLIVIGAIYVTIVRFLRTQNPTTVDQHRARQRTSKACRVVSLVVIVFGVLWLPYHVNTILACFGGIPDSPFYEVLRVLWFCMSYGNSCANPIIYNYASSEFRAGFRRAIHRLFVCLPEQGDNQVSEPTRRVLGTSQMFRMSPLPRSAALSAVRM